jgi:cytidylate kinase
MTAVAIDGPAGVGKSTVARAVAERLGFRYVDTGAMYRAVTAVLIDRGLPFEDAGRVAREIDISFDGDRVMVDGEDVSARIRDDDVTAAVSEVAADPEVRASLREAQREIAAGGDVVMEGRDIGSAVLTDADAKVFMTASLTVRAGRRGRQFGLDPTEEVESALSARDSADAARADSPFVRAEDAVVIDTTDKNVDAVVDDVLRVVRRNLGRR